jgi:hypothetical protein
MISKFFIDRPIFASVLSLLIIIAGGAAIFALPVARYPEIVPPTIQINATYPGADVQTVAELLGEGAVGERPAGRRAHRQSCGDGPGHLASRAATTPAQ